MKKSNLTKEFNLLELFEGFLFFWTNLSVDIEKHYNEDVNLINNEGQPINNVPRYIQRQLCEYFDNQKDQVDTNALPKQHILYQKYLYAMSAFIDEQLLKSVKWSEQKQWLPLMLELKLFGSRNSGEKLIEQIQAFSIKTDVFSDDEKKLAGCYLRILWLGFSGKYANDLKVINQLKTQLTNQAELTIPDLSVKTLMAQAYLCNIINEKQSRLAPISRWQRLILLGMGFYLLLAGFLWYVLTYQLENVLTS